MPRAKGLYRRAIMDSAPVFRPQLAIADAEKAGVVLVGNANLAALRAMPAADLVKRIPPLDPDTRSDIAITLGPAFAAGNQNIVPIIVGNNVNEGSFFARGVPVKTLAMYDAALQKRFGANAARARVLYPATDDAAAHDAESTIVGDMDINTGVRKMAIVMAKSDELPYVFGTPNVGGVGQPAPAFDDTDYRVSEAMMRAWSQFAKTGNPNVPGSHAWPEYTAGADRFVVFGDTTSTGTAFRTAELDFLDKTTGR